MNTKKSLRYRIRKTHRYLGLFLGIQFLMWTIGGLYFSWINMDEVHGDHQRKPAVLLSVDQPFVSPQVALYNLRRIQPIDSLFNLQLIPILDKPYYQVNYVLQGDASHRKRVQLADATTGELRAPLSKPEAVAVAKSQFTEQASVSRVEYLTEVNAHHEYRENPLPAYAVSFDNANRTTVYVATELGTVQKFRNRSWRFFDFLWMLHTMDYQSRDNFGNVLLKTFSVVGLITVLSGFALYGVSSPSIRKLRKKVA
ncbi:MAG: hypothetical protein H7Z75_10235 [Ferruginibacter sp.]|nr:hypothetical protein [Cytophagales bacterium]